MQQSKQCCFHRLCRSVEDNLDIRSFIYNDSCNRGHLQRWYRTAQLTFQPINQGGRFLCPPCSSDTAMHGTPCHSSVHSFRQEIATSPPLAAPRNDIFVGGTLSLPCFFDNSILNLKPFQLTFLSVACIIYAEIFGFPTS